MSYRYGTTLVPGAYHYGGGGLGVRGDAVPSTGAAGPGYLYTGLGLPADAAKEVRGIITRWPAGTLTASEDSSFSYAGPTDYALYQLFVDGQASNTDIGYGAGIGRFGLLVGAGSPAQITGSITMADSAPSGVIYTTTGGVASPGYLLISPRRKLEITVHSVANFEFDVKDPEERVRVGFDFASLIPAIAGSPAPTIVASQASGTADSTPSAVLDGSVSISGTKVLQWVSGGLDSANYRLRCKAYGPNGELFVLAGILPVKTA